MTARKDQLELNRSRKNLRRDVGRAIADFNMIEDGGSGISSGPEARKTVQIVEGFVKSNYQGGRLISVPT